MGTVMGIMMAIMLIGALVWGSHHGMTGDHGPGKHTEESESIKEDAKGPCQPPDCDAEESKEDANQVGMEGI